MHRFFIFALSVALTLGAGVVALFRHSMRGLEKVVVDIAAGLDTAEFRMPVGTGSRIIRSGSIVGMIDYILIAPRRAEVDEPVRFIARPINSLAMLGVDSATALWGLLHAVADTSDDLTIELVSQQPNTNQIGELEIAGRSPIPLHSPYTYPRASRP